MKKIVITGGCGFLGHHVVEHFLKNTEAEIVILDKLEHTFGMQRLWDIKCFDDKRVFMHSANLAEPLTPGLIHEIYDADVILHIAAESHVDNSIAYPAPFIKNNVMSTVHLMDAIRGFKVRPRFVYFSTDEVFGPAPAGVEYKEMDRHCPQNPYAASKSASEQCVVSYANTYGMDTIITRCMNIFGERQHPEKFIPLIVRHVRDGEKLTIHADPTKTKAGSRFYIHARNVADALLTILNANVSGEVFHIVGEREIDNLTLAQMVASIIGKELNYEMVDFHSSRPGHDLRYAMSGERIKARLGWEPPMHVELSLKKTVEWTMNNQRWLEEPDLGLV